MSVWFLNIKNIAKKTKKIITISFVLVFISVVLLFAHSAEATSATWTGLGADSLWATTGNWSTSPVPGTGDTATFNSAGNAKRTPDLGAGVTINSLLFDTASAAAYVIGTTNAQVLTWNDGGSFTMNSTVANTEQVKAKVIFDTAGGNYTITSHNTGRSFVFSDAGVGNVAFVGPASGSGTSTLNIVADGLISGFPTVSIRGYIQDGTGNAVKLVKSGAGSLQICSSAGGYTYTGGTYLNAGALLIVGNAGCIKSGTSLYIADAGTTLCSVNQTGGTYTNIASQWNGDWTFNDNTKGNSGIQQMTFTGGTVDLGSQNSGGTTANPARTVRALANTLTINSVISNGSNGLTTGLTKTGAGTMVLTGANTYISTTTVSAGTLQIGSAGTVGSLNPTGPIVNNSTLTFNRTNTITQGTDFGTISSGSGALTQAGTGKTILNNINNYSGTTTISAGTLQIGDGVTDGSIASSSKIINNATLTYNLVGARTYGNIISGTGQLFKLGTGIFTLTGVNTYTGTTTISGGTLQIGDGVTDGSIASSSKIINNDALIYNINVPRTYANPISGTGSLTKLGTGTLTISGGATYTSTTTVATGTLAFTTVVPASTVWDNSITNSSTYAVMTLPNNPDLTGKTINISSTATDNNYSTDLITWTGIAVGTPTLKLNGVIVSSGVYTGNTKITFNANAITFTRGAVPSAPTNLILTASSTEVILNWTAPSSDTPITDYVVDFKPTSTTTWSTFSDGVSASTTSTVIGLTNGLSYDFRVSAYNAAGQGTPSDVASTTPVGIPVAPISVVAVRGNNQATVTFTLLSDGGSAILYYTIISSPGNISTTTATTTGVVTGLTNGTAYTFTVTATNAAGTGSPSAASNSVIPATVPDAPTAFSATVGNTQISLFWSAPVYDGGSPLTDYIVDYKLTSTSTWSTFADAVSTSTTATVTGLINGSSYDFRVFAINDVGQGSASSIISATPITVPDAPIIATSTRGNTQASVTFFPPVSNGGSTILSYTATSNPGSFIGSGASSPIIVAGLTNGTSYTFTVTATNAAGTGSSSAASNSVIPATVPDAPTSVIATAGQGQVGLSWTVPGSNGGDAIIDYVVDYKLTSTSTWSTFSDGVSTNATSTVTGLQNGSFYDFRVSAINTVGQGSPSIDVSAKPITVPDAPTIGSATEGNAQAIVTFTPPVFDGGTSINSYTVTSNPGNISASGANSPIIVTGLTNGTSYNFTVTATNAVGVSASSTISNSVIPVTIPGAPINVTAAEGNTQATITFSPPVSDGGTAITSYKVTSSPGGIISTGSSSPIIVTGLTNGTTYTFTVNATNAVGEGPTSTPSNSVTLSTEPGIPVNLAATVLGSSIGLSWSAPALDGGKPIIDYIVEYQLTTGGTWSVFADGTSISTTATVTGLSNDTSYDFRIRAVNIIGQSAPSATIAATPGEPAQVIIQSFSDLTNPSIGTNVRITNEGSIQYEYQYTWCVTDSSVNICGGGDDIFSAGAAKLIQPLQNYDFSATSTVPTPGTYWFHVNVTYGSKTSTAYQSFIAVATYPDAPTAVSAVFGDAQATVTFTPPVSNGGSIITSYKVTSSPGGITATGGSSPITVSGLTNGTSYTFIVTAINAVGEGSASTPSNSVMPATIPDAPTGLLASAGNAQVGLSWTAPLNTGGLPINDYIIEYKLNSDSVWQVFADGISAGTSVIVTGLTNNLSYDFRVSAVNAIGQSLVNSTNANPTSPATNSSGNATRRIINLQSSTTTLTVPAPVAIIIPVSPVIKVPTIPGSKTAEVKTPIPPVEKVPEVITPLTGKNETTITPTATSVISLVPSGLYICDFKMKIVFYIFIALIIILSGLISWLFFIILRLRKRKKKEEDDKEDTHISRDNIKPIVGVNTNTVKRDDYFKKITPRRKSRVDSL